MKPFSALLLLGVICTLVAQEKRALPFAHISEYIHMQEVATITRSIGDIRQASLDQPGRIFSIDGTPAQAAVAEWLVARLDVPAGSPLPAVERFEMLATPDPHVRIFRPVRATTPVALQELTTLIRTVGDIRRAFLSQRGNAIVLRGSAGEMALAEWLFDHLEHPSRTTESTRFGSGEDNEVRIFFFPESTTPETLKAYAGHVRSDHQIRRAFAYPAERAIALRGTPEQVAAAAGVLEK